ncbi:hypothetical protein GCM10007418_32640 [Halopseudomonas salina]|uniref:Uncharacterized protein n=1 Tax=Halopseudomonas salina TaxID=1323744 RepID=A0ABQ1Q303_9GAMM|nr:hypothetical protein GCM10007418_32640 [Halopseudomonas salina]
MNLRQLRTAWREGNVLNINIITHSGLNRYAVRVVTREAGTVMVTGSDRSPIYWLSVMQLQRELRRHGVTSPVLQVTVAQDEVIGR